MCGEGGEMPSSTGREQLYYGTVQGKGLFA